MPRARLIQTFRVAMGALAGLLLGASAAAPQSETAVLSGLGIDLWPDYDRPGVLVIYRATIAPEASLPARLAFRIPAAAGLPNAVAERPAGGQLITLPYERTVNGETALIELTASQPFVQLEYYDSAIARNGARRSFVFIWSGDVEVRNFSISLQQPHLAQNFTTVPEVTSVATSVDGLIYRTLSRAVVKAGETVELSVSYEKVSDQLTVETIAPAAAPAPTPMPANAATAGNTTLLIGLVLAAIAVCAGAAIVVVRVRKRGQVGSGSRSTSPARAVRTGAPGTRASRFCTQCGARVEGSDRFCQRCGTALKG